MTAKESRDIRDTLADERVRIVVDDRDDNLVCLGQKRQCVSDGATRLARVLPGNQHCRGQDMFDVACNDQHWSTGIER